MAEDHLEHLEVQLATVRLHSVIAGPEKGELVVLLHGFPEFWYGWRKQIPALASAGFRVAVPDQRGYNQSEKPRRIRDYRVDRLAGDIAELIDALGQESACVVGHDWGAGVAWWLALTRPERVRRLAILNGPHPRAMFRSLWRSGRQRRLSWYMLFFQLPWIPEAVIRRRNWETFAQSIRNSARPGTFGDLDVARYRQAWSQAGAMTSMLNWYRALRYAPPRPTRWEVQPPTLIVWGEHDAFLDPSLAQQSADLCRESRLVLYDRATHWVQLEEAERVNEELTRFFSNP